MFLILQGIVFLLNNNLGIFFPVSFFLQSIDLLVAAVNLVVQLGYDLFFVI